MKKIALVFCSLLFTWIIQAQPLPGTWCFKLSTALPGQFSTVEQEYNAQYASSSSKYKIRSINFQPQVGMYISHFVNIGLFTDFKINNSIGDIYYQKEKSFSFGPYLRAYFIDLDDSKLVPFGCISGGWSKYHLTGHSSSGDADVSMFGSVFKIGSGIEYFISKKIEVEAMLNYQFVSVSKSEQNGLLNTYSMLQKTHGIEFCLGISFLLEKRREINNAEPKAYP